MQDRQLMLQPSASSMSKISFPAKTTASGRMLRRGTH